MKGPDSKIIGAYDSAGAEYDDAANITSCWGKVGVDAGASIHPDPRSRVIADVGCGTGPVIERLVKEFPAETKFYGVEPADGMRKQAEAKLGAHGNVALLSGSFESLPLADASVDYLYSILAFHWTTDVEGSVRELARVLKPGAAMDLYFTGRYSGKEFIEATSPVYRKYLGFRQWLQTAKRRQGLTLEQVQDVFGRAFGARVSAKETYELHYDTLAGHMGWWVRIRGHFDEIDPKDREACDREIDEAIAATGTEKGIPYTVHLIHVRLEP